MVTKDVLMAEISKNASDEFGAIAGYSKLLDMIENGVTGVDKTVLDDIAGDIREIISDELNHAGKEKEMFIKLSDITPATD